VVHVWTQNQRGRESDRKVFIYDGTYDEIATSLQIFSSNFDEVTSHQPSARSLEESKINPDKYSNDTRDFKDGTNVTRIAIQASFG
jgi:hypothetical protein